ncbi:hypothetical protein F511_19931 [Dorcoceras hygrometricum]|uniref:Uncharacterized protein n=1 Tax=Dorcoceras hygrometricum TaxID=472368 RepID=A0A2Z7DE29_9LAMI|nr:hypothetical protein F511_19931 [Dorcoceras hygrometricum]
MTRSETPSQAALEALTRSERTDSPRRIGRKQVFGEDGGGGGGAWRRRRRLESEECGG